MSKVSESRTKCKLCKGETATVKLIPSGLRFKVNKEPDPEGSIAVTREPNEGPPIGVLVSKTSPPDATRYRLHSDTCSAPDWMRIRGE